jgi:Helix-turn-helix domain
MNRPTLPPTKHVMNEHEAAEWLGLDVTTLRDWRFRRVGPAYLKYLNKAVRYPLAELSRFAEQSKVQTAA